MHSVAIIGASGYTGALAASLLDAHPEFELSALTARSDVGKSLSSLYPHHRVALQLEEFDVDKHGSVDAAVVAYPHGAAAPTVAALRERGVKVVDLSADFRLTDQGVYEQWYCEHGAPELFGKGVYGLPELYRDQIAGASLVANPGCYPTATLLALAPLAAAGLIGDVVIDAKSGISGAGRKLSDATSFVGANENLSPYGVAGHRHRPEIAQELVLLGADVEPLFIPHLVPLDQGELVSCYVTPTRAVEAAELEQLFQQRYAKEQFVEVATVPPGVKDVQGTNICRIYAQVDEPSGKLLVFAVIDNLWKGASSQAVQNLNLMFGLPEAEGLS